MNVYQKIGLAMPVVALLIVGTYVLLEQPGTGKKIPNLSLRSGESSPSSEFLNAHRAVEYYREAIRRKPDNVTNYIELAQLFLREMRITGNDLEYIPKAQWLLEEALRMDPENGRAMITKASMLMSTHHFREAKYLAQRAIARNPYSASAHGVLTDALVELGEYDEAVRTCDSMLGIRPDLSSYSRASYLRELHGDLQGAREAMQLASDAGIFGHENRAWALYNLGNLYLHQGKIETALYIFNGILQERPHYAHAFGGLAQVKSAKGEFTEAIKLLKKSYEITPDHLFLEQLADIYRAVGRTQEANVAARKVLEAFEQDDRQGWNIDLEYALFCADHDMNLSEALKRAKKEYARRPNNIEVLESYAWTLYKNGYAMDAVPVIERAMRLNTRSSILHYRAGMIYYATGQREKALGNLERSLNENPFVKALYAESARETLSSLKKLAHTN